MSSIPQGAFAAMKVHQNLEENRYSFNSFKSEKPTITYPPVNKKLIEDSPLKYNSKLMNSIWGQYNRYSVHNLKKNIDDNKISIWEEQTLATTVSPSIYTSLGFDPTFINTLM